MVILFHARFWEMVFCPTFRCNSSFPGIIIIFSPEDWQELCPKSLWFPPSILLFSIYSRTFVPTFGSVSGSFAQSAEFPVAILFFFVSFTVFCIQSAKVDSRMPILCRLCSALSAWHRGVRQPIFPFCNFRLLAIQYHGSLFSRFAILGRSRSTTAAAYFLVL